MKFDFFYAIFRNVVRLFIDIFFNKSYNGIKLNLAL